MNYKLMEAFAAAVEEGSFTAAAKRLYISQPALSQQIAQLEADIGFKLFHRANYAVTLTEAGKEFYLCTQHLFELYSDALYRCREIAGITDEAPVRPCCSSGVDNWLNLLIFKAFLEQYPRLKIEPHDTEASKRVADVASNRADVAIYFPSPEVEETGLEFHHLFYDKDYFLMTSDHPLAGNKAIRPEDMFGHTVCINKDMKSENLIRLRAFINEHKDKITMMPVPLSASTVVTAAAHGGMALVPGAAAKNNKYGLTAVPLEWKYSIDIGIICRPNPRASIRKYIEVAQSVFKDYEA